MATVVDRGRCLVGPGCIPESPVNRSILRRRLPVYDDTLKIVVLRIFGGRLRGFLLCCGGVGVAFAMIVYARSSISGSLRVCRLLDAFDHLSVVDQAFIVRDLPGCRCFRSRSHQQVAYTTGVSVITRFLFVFCFLILVFRRWTFFLCLVYSISDTQP